MTEIAEENQTDRLGLEARLLDRIRRGDCEAAAEFLAMQQDLLRHRYRWRLGPARQSVGATDDLMSSVGRRFCEVVRRRRLRASGVGRLCSFLDAVTKRTSQQMLRRAARIESIEHRALGCRADGSFNAAVLKPTTDLPLGLLDDLSREVVILRMRDLEYSAIGEVCGISATAARQRYRRSIKRMQEALNGKDGT